MPNKRLVIYPYKMSSASCNALVAELRSRGEEVLKVYPDRKYSPKARDVIINWGSSVVPKWDNEGRILNHPLAAQCAGNKLTALRAFSEHSVRAPSYTTNQAEAQDWVNQGKVVVGRHLLRGHSGEGIALYGAEIEHDGVTGTVAPAPLYTVYVKKSREYRVHIFNGEIIDWQQKMAVKDFDGEINYQIRSHQNGWIYAREAAVAPDSIIRGTAVAAVRACGLVSGAVDVIYNEKQARAYVLEVNTAPGLTGTTLTNYADAIQRGLL